MLKYANFYLVFQAVGYFKFIQIVYLRQMFLYNVTIIIEKDIHEDVRRHIEQQLFDKKDVQNGITLLEMLDSPHEGITYCIQLRSDNKDDIARFQSQHISVIQQLANSEYPGKILFFDSTMKFLNHG